MLRTQVPAQDRMVLGFNDSGLHKGKVLVSAKDINFKYGAGWLWQNCLTFQISSGLRLRIKGANGSGKTSLIQIILGIRKPQAGHIQLAENTYAYIDQDYSLLNPLLTVYEQALEFNHSHLMEYEVKTRLHRFLFTKNDWDKSSASLSGGERMRLMLCCISLYSQAPDMLILDEPTNNLDIQNIDMLTAALIGYPGTLLLVSHDEYFINQLQIEQTMEL